MFYRFSTFILTVIKKVTLVIPQHRASPNFIFSITLFFFLKIVHPMFSVIYLDGEPVMMTGSPIGNICLWNLTTKQIHTEVKSAHSGSITSIISLQNEPLFVTSSTDNALKVTAAVDVYDFLLFH